MKFLYYIELMILLSSIIYVGLKIYPISKQIKIEDINFNKLKRINRLNIGLIKKEFVKKFNLLGNNKKKVSIAIGILVATSLIMIVFGPVRYVSDVYISTSQYHQIKLAKKQARQIKQGLNNPKNKNQIKESFKAFNSLKETAMISDPSIDTKDTVEDMAFQYTEDAKKSLENYADRLVNGRTLDNQDEPKSEYSDGYEAVATFNSAFELANSARKSADYAADYKKELHSLVTLAGSAIISENNSVANIKAHSDDLEKKLTSGI